MTEELNARIVLVGSHLREISSRREHKSSETIYIALVISGGDPQKYDPKAFRDALHEHTCNKFGDIYFPSGIILNADSVKDMRGLNHDPQLKLYQHETEKLFSFSRRISCSQYFFYGGHDIQDLNRNDISIWAQMNDRDIVRRCKLIDNMDEFVLYLWTFENDYDCHRRDRMILNYQFLVNTSFS